MGLLRLALLNGYRGKFYNAHHPVHCVNGEAIPIRLALLGARCGLCEPLVSPFAPRVKNETFAERKATLIGREVPPTRKNYYKGARFLGTYLIGRLPYGYGKTCGVGLVALRTRTLRRQEAGVRRQGSKNAWFQINVQSGFLA